MSHNIKFLILALSFLGILGSYSSASADEYTSNQEIALNSVLQQGYNEEQANQIVADLNVTNEGTLIGVDVVPAQPSLLMQNAAMMKASVVSSTSTQYLSKKDVREIYSNLNAIDKGSAILGAIVGGKSSVLGTIIGLGGFQNPKFKDAITKAYHQGKRVKIVTHFGASMSLNTVTYSVVK